MSSYFDLGIADASFTAGEDLSASSRQYRFVALTTASNNAVILATGASLPVPIGVLQNSPCQFEEAQVCLIGPTKLLVSASADVNQTGGSPIYAGNWLIAGACGAGIKVTPGTASPALARALENGPTTGYAYINVLLLPGAFHLSAS